MENFKIEQFNFNFKIQLQISKVIAFINSYFGQFMYALYQTFFSNNYISTGIWCICAKVLLKFTQYGIKQ